MDTDRSLRARMRKMPVEKSRTPSPRGDGDGDTIAEHLHDDHPSPYEPSEHVTPPIEIGDTGMSIAAGKNAARDLREKPEWRRLGAPPSTWWASAVGRAARRPVEEAGEPEETHLRTPTQSASEGEPSPAQSSLALRAWYVCTRRLRRRSCRWGSRLPSCPEAGRRPSARTWSGTRPSS